MNRGWRKPWRPTQALSGASGHPKVPLAASSGAQIPNESVRPSPERFFQTAQGDVCWKGVTWTVCPPGASVSVGH